MKAAIITSAVCAVCETVNDRRRSSAVCSQCHENAIIWAAKQAHAAANPPPAPAPPECPKSRTGRHEYLQVRGGHVCNACQKQVSG